MPSTMHLAVRNVPGSTSRSVFDGLVFLVNVNEKGRKRYSKEPVGKIDGASTKWRAYKRNEHYGRYHGHQIPEYTLLGTFPTRKLAMETLTLQVLPKFNGFAIQKYGTLPLSTVKAIVQQFELSGHTTHTDGCPLMAYITEYCERQGIAYGIKRMPGRGTIIHILAEETIDTASIVFDPVATVEQRAYLLFLEDTIGQAEVAPLWDDLPPETQNTYLQRLLAPVEPTQISTTSHRPPEAI